LPDRVSGSALFADISGFTALTDALTNSLGSRRGSEELTKRLNAVYNALIADVERYGGSVLSFSGDAITCWFDNSQGPAAPRATACSLSLQKAMRAFAEITLPNGATTTLKLKVAVASGPARRFVVGDPSFHYMDALTGATVARTSLGEQLAEKGDILLDEATVKLLEPDVSVQEWRSSPSSGERFAVVMQFTGSADEISFPDPLPGLEVAVLRPWIHHSVYEREQDGQQVFMTEFRPCIALFVRFMGIDYDSAEAEKQLDLFVRQAQAVTTRHDGTLLQITFGDKGSYAYINFGVMSTHEDDAQRAVLTALELRNAVNELDYPLTIQIGITQGVMRVGAYGGKTRRTYGALGDGVNLAARLMQAAAPDEILVSGRIQRAAATLFNFEYRDALILKGKSTPLIVYLVRGEQHQRSIRLQEPAYALPMIGRHSELQIINACLDLAAQRKAQLIGIVAEAGLGKSRLMAEAIRAAKSKGFAGYGGACQSMGISTPYLVWKSIWSAFFNVDPDLPDQTQIRLLEHQVRNRAPNRLRALPLLGPILDINIPENEFTRGLEPKNRKGALHALLADCLRADLQAEPHIVVLEDLHWVDALSYELLEELAHELTDYPICFMLAYRPLLLAQVGIHTLARLPHFTKIELSELNAEECKQVIQAKLIQLYPDRAGDIPDRLVQMMEARAQGNPFYLEELLNLLRDRRIDLHNPATLDQIELPDSLHTLILSRIDQLTDLEKTSLRVASIIGRLFRFAWLTGYYPTLGDLPQIKNILDKLSRLDIVPMDTPEPELVYLFKHIVTHDVAYETLPFSTRAQLHEQLARYLEVTYPDSLPLNELAFHYGRSENKAKQCEYVRKSAEAAQAAYANEAAQSYYKQLLELIPDGPQKVEIHLQRGDVLGITGDWDEAEAEYHSALQIATQFGDRNATAQSKVKLGSLSTLRGNYDVALDWLSHARQELEMEGDRMRLGRALYSTGSVFMQKSEYVLARQYFQQAIEQAHQSEDKRLTAEILNSQGMASVEQGDYDAARILLEESLGLFRQIGSKEGIGMTTNNLGLVALEQGDFANAWLQFEETLQLAREMGNTRGIAIGLSNLGYTAANRGDFAAAQQPYAESLVIYRKTGNKPGIAMSLENLGFAEIEQGDYVTAQTHYAESLQLAYEIGNKFHIVYSLLGLGSAGIKVWTSPTVNVLRAQTAVQLIAVADSLLKSMNMTLERLERNQFEHMVGTARAAIGEDTFERAWAEGQTMSMDAAVALALNKVGPA
jgi:class 3 adenylate cyclase/tetratricopeptide (TPR) repeat protein